MGLCFTREAELRFPASTVDDECPVCRLLTRISQLLNRPCECRHHGPFSDCRMVFRHRLHAYAEKLVFVSIVPESGRVRLSLCKRRFRVARGRDADLSLVVMRDSAEEAAEAIKEHFMG